VFTEKFRSPPDVASMLGMPRPRALLLDFYGTLVHEDIEAVDFICQEVSRNAPTAGPAEVARTWWSSFSALTRASHGPGFRLQRDLARESLTDTVRYHQSAADPGLLLESQFAYWQRPEIYPDTRELLATAPDLDAVFAASDLMADGALRMLRQAGRRVPDDVAVIGFDDNVVAAFADPPLTTVRQPIQDLGRGLARQLLRLLDGEDVEDAYMLPTQLVIRESA